MTSIATTSWAFRKYTELSPPERIAQHDQYIFDINNLLAAMDDLLKKGINSILFIALLPKELQKIAEILIAKRKPDANPYLSLPGDVETFTILRRLRN